MLPLAAETDRRTVWRRAYIALGCATVGLLALYLPTVTSIVEFWSENPLGQGYVVVPAAMWLAWIRKKEIEALRPTPTPLALPVLGVLSFVWLLGNLSGTVMVQQFSLVAMLVSLVWGILGTSIVRVLIFPFALLVCALPWADRLIPALQDLTARIAVQMLTLSGVPTLLQWHTISIPGSSWEVAEACGGINYLTASVTFGYIYSGLVYQWWVHRVGFFVASILMPLIANALRVYTTILIASLGGTRVAAGLGHEIYGWLVFAIILSLLVATCGHWREDNLKTPEGCRPEPHFSQPLNPILIAVPALLLVGIAPLSAKSFWSAPQEAGFTTPGPPSVSPPWRVADRVPFAWSPRLVTPRAESLHTYSSSNRFVTLYLAFYGGGTPNEKLASSGGALFDAPWLAIDQGRDTLVHESRSYSVPATFLRSPQSSLVVWRWYCVDGRFTASDYWAKFLFARSRLLHPGRLATTVAVATETGPSIDSATILNDFIAHVSLPESVCPAEGQSAR